MASLSGSVFDELGGPVIAAKLSLRSEKSRLYLTKTTEQGTFLFPASRSRAVTRCLSPLNGNGSYSCTSKNLSKPSLAARTVAEMTKAIESACEGVDPGEW